MEYKKIQSFMEARGFIQYNMTNNYMFRYILQKYNNILKGLICSLLHLNPKNIKSIEIKNPIDLAGDVSGKEFILDIKVMLNDDTLINLEMQVANEDNWPERSLTYLCRAFDQLQRGQEYEEVLPAIHIGFLDFKLFPEETEFYSTYRMLNIKTYREYSSKFTLSVVQLNNTKYATDEDKAYGIDYWARIFRAKTWEEMKMLANNNEFLEETAEALYIANADEIVRQQCLAREDAERRERTLVRNNKKLKDENAELKDALSELQMYKVQNERKEKLLKILADNNRINDWKRAMNKGTDCTDLYKEFNI